MLILLVLFPGFVIYFGYGIHHSAEGRLARSRSSPEMDTEMDGFKPSHGHNGEAMSPEKEAFLHNGVEARLEDDL